MNIENIKRIAEDISVKAGERLLSVLDEEMEIMHKGEVDLVTKADLESEEIIISSIKREIGNMPIWTEEVGMVDGDLDTDQIWLIDPLDGTTNYAHRYPHFCVSMALLEKKRPLIGVVFDPIRRELFSSMRGGGATMNGRYIRVSSIKDLNDALIVTGFPYDRREKAEFYMGFFREFMKRSQGIRRDGAAALNLAYVGAGRFDGFYEFGLKAWDMAAGWLIVEEAGGVVSGMEGEEFDPFCARIVAGNPDIHREMVKWTKWILSTSSSGF